MEKNLMMKLNTDTRDDEVSPTTVGTTTANIPTKGTMYFGTGSYPQYSSGDMSQTTTGTGAWTNYYTCPNCGQYVTGLHSCYPKTYNPPAITYVYPQIIDLKPLTDKLDELLKEIRAVRKQLAKGK